MCGLVRKLESENKLTWFTTHRANLEAFLLRHRDFTNEIVNHSGGRLKSYDGLMTYYLFVLDHIAARRNEDEIVDALQAMQGFSYLKGRRPYETKRKDFSKTIRTVTYIRSAITGALRCNICHALIGPRSISYDHDQEVRNDGLGSAKNARLAHFYCNTGYRESGGAGIPAPTIAAYAPPTD